MKPQIHLTNIKIDSKNRSFDTKIRPVARDGRYKIHAFEKGVKVELQGSCSVVQAL